MPGSTLFGALFFGSLAIAGFTSLISLVLGVSVAFQEKFGLSRTVAAVSVGIVSAIVSFTLFATTTGLIALDTVDQFANNIGIVASAIAMCVIVVWLSRTVETLRAHLNAVSTFKVGKWWIPVIGLYAPIFLGVMLVQKIYDLVTEGYEGYPTWYVGVFGWGTVAFLVVFAGILTAIKWGGRDDPGFIPWPPVDTARPSARTAKEMTK